MEEINQSEFERRRGGHGYIYNDDQGGPEMHILHRATCSTLVRAKVPPRKYFCSDLQAAVNWLNINRGSENGNWHRCQAQDTGCFG